MTTRRITGIILYGLIIYIGWNIGLFGASMVFGFEDTSPPPARDMLFGTLVSAVVVGALSWLGVKWLRLTDQRQRLMAGTVWALVVIVLLLVVTVGNKTTGIVFGQWGTYVSFLAVVVGAVLNRPRVRGAPTPPPGVTQQ